MDFISRSALQERFASECIGECSCCTHNYEGLDGMGYCGLINEAPGVDVEKVLRCENCRHWGTGYGGETDRVKVCEFANYMVGANGYCVYGERKEPIDNENHN